MVSIFCKYCRVLAPGEIIDLCWLRRLIEELDNHLAQELRKWVRVKRKLYMIPLSLECCLHAPAWRGITDSGEYDNRAKQWLRN